MNPIRDAIVVAGPGDDRATVAGVPLLLRTLLTLQRNGIERVTLVGAEPPRDERLTIPIARKPDIVAPPTDALHLLVGAASVIDGALVAHLQASSVDGAIADFACDGARVRVAPGSRIAEPSTAISAPPRGTLASTAATETALQRTLLYGLENPRDGYLDRILHRHLSRPLTRLLLHTPLTPNAITCLGIAVGTLAGWVLGYPGTLAAIGAMLLLTLSSVLDCCDGEVARIRFAESKIGHALDVTGDTLVHVALFAGIARRLAASGTIPDRTILGVLGAGILASFAVITWSESTERRREAVDCWENRVLANVLSPLTTRDWHVFPLAFALAGRLDMLVPAAAIGAHVFWIVTLIVLRRALGRV